MMSGQRRNKTIAVGLYSLRPKLKGVEAWHLISSNSLRLYRSYFLSSTHFETWVLNLSPTDICTSSTPTYHSPSRDVVAFYHASPTVPTGKRL